MISIKIILEKLSQRAVKLTQGIRNAVNKGLLKPVVLFSSLIIICISLFLGILLISDSISNQKNHNDYAEINNIKYGLFSVNDWKDQISVILNDEINKLYLSKPVVLELKKHIEVLLNTLLDKVVSNIKEGNEGSAGGFVKQALINIFVNLNDIKKGIPDYSDSIINEVNKPNSKRVIKNMLHKQLTEFLTNTYETEDLSKVNNIMLRFSSTNIADAEVKLDKVISDMNGKIAFDAMMLIILSVVLFAMSGLSKRSLIPVIYIILVVSLLTLLFTGITLPMINLEAKITKLSFVLMGHTIHFENQILYFQSKSILDVFWVMITHPDIQMKFIGILMITFSIVFPMLKIISTLGFYFDYRGSRTNPVINFFIRKSGKWSMADVTVIAIFMAYIGFNGIMTSQFGQMNSSSPELVLVTTSGTTLQPGYFLFLSYALLALFFSGILTSESRIPDTKRKRLKTGHSALKR